jgi:hypothetical protein
MAELNLEKINNNMYGLVQIQKEMLTILRASSTAMKVQSKAMETLGESAKEASKNTDELQTRLGRFIEKKLRATSGAAGIFHKLMYGVPGYFIFKNRMDTLLSGIDKFIMQPLSGNKKEGFLNKVLYGVGGSFRKSKDQLLTLNSLVRDGPQLMQGPAPKGGFRNPNTGRFESRPELNLMTWITKSKLGLFVSKSMHELKKQGRWSRFKNKLAAKGKSFISFLQKGRLFFAAALLVFAKVAFAVLAGLVALFFLVKIIKGLGVSGKSLENWAKGMLTVVMGGLIMIGNGIGRVIDGATMMYDAIFGDGTLTDLIDGFLETMNGLLEIFGGILLILFSPILGAIETKLGDYGKNIEEKVTAVINLFGLVLVGLGVIVATVVLIVALVSASIAILTALPIIIGGLLIAAIGLFLAKINPFANGGVTKSGLSLVGERGPELVRLPKGSRVHSNQESRKMVSSGGNNITVNINGRVGSSDSELRIIAQKVGKMINKEINRTTSSRSLGA